MVRKSVVPQPGQRGMALQALPAAVEPRAGLGYPPPPLDEKSGPARGRAVPFSTPARHADQAAPPTRLPAVTATSGHGGSC